MIYFSLDSLCPYHYLKIKLHFARDASEYEFKNHIMMYFPKLTMIRFILFFLYTIPGYVNSLEKFSCDQPFLPTDGMGFSAVLKVSNFNGVSSSSYIFFSSNSRLAPTINFNWTSIGLTTNGEQP